MISSLKSEGIRFYFDQNTTKVKTNYGIINNVEDYVERRLENVVFEKNGVEYKIYEGLFFRDFGQIKYFKKIKGDYVYVDLDDATFYDFQKLMILKYFEKK